MRSEVTDHIKHYLKHLLITLSILVSGLLISYVIPFKLPQNLLGILSIIIIFATVIMFILSKITVTMRFVHAYSFILGISLYPILFNYIGALFTNMILSLYVGALAFVGALTYLCYQDGSDEILRVIPILFSFLSGVAMVFLFTKVVIRNKGDEALIISVFLALLAISVIFNIYKLQTTLDYIKTSDDIALSVLRIYAFWISIFIFFLL